MTWLHPNHLSHPGTTDSEMVQHTCSWAYRWPVPSTSWSVASKQWWRLWFSDDTSPKWLRFMWRHWAWPTIWWGSAPIGRWCGGWAASSQAPEVFGQQIHWTVEISGPRSVPKSTSTLVWDWIHGTSECSWKSTCIRYAWETVPRTKAWCVEGIYDKTVWEHAMASHSDLFLALVYQCCWSATHQVCYAIKLEWWSHGAGSGFQRTVHKRLLAECGEALRAQPPGSNWTRNFPRTSEILGTRAADWSLHAIHCSCRCWECQAGIIEHIHACIQASLQNPVEVSWQGRVWTMWCMLPLQAKDQKG